MTPKAHCLTDLSDRILSLELAPGVELDETRLAANYGLSRTPLREVFRHLAGEGYLLLQPNRGARVSPLDFSALRVFFRSAPLVYAAIARMAAEYRTDAQMDGLRAAQAAYTAANDDVAVALTNHRFHSVIAEMAANPYLAPSHGRLLIDHTRLSVGVTRPTKKKEKKAIKKSVQQHDALIAAIDARDPETAVAVTLEHWDLARSRFDTIMAGDPIPDLPVLPEPA